MTDDSDKQDAYNDGQRDARLRQMEQDVSDIKPRLGRVERIVYGALGIFGLISYWPSIQRFFGGGE